MDVKDQITHTTHSGVYICHKCGWPFPNPHPSAKHRRAHKKICGTIDGYINMIGSEVVSDDDKEKTPSPKIENIGGGTRVSFSRSEDELFSDAVTEVSDSGSANKTLDRDLFLEFKDAENDGANELLNAPIKISKVDTGVEVSEKIDTHVGKIGETEITALCDSSESNLELTETGLVKDGVTGQAPEQSHISHSQETKSIDVMEAVDEKSQESQASETSTKEAKDSEVTKTSPEVSSIVDGDHDSVKQEIKSVCEHVSEVVNEYETVEETNIKKLDLEYEISPEVVKESETDHLEGVAEEVKHENYESDHNQDPEVAKEPATFQNVSVLIEKEGVAEEVKHENYESDPKQDPEVAKGPATVQNVSVLVEKEDFGAPNVQIQESFKEPVAVLTEKKDLEAHELEASSIEQIQEVVKEPDTVLTEKEDLGGPHLEKQLNEHTHEVVENLISVLSEKQDLGAPELGKGSKEQIQEVVKQPDTGLTEKEDLSGSNLEKQLNEHTHEVVENPISVLSEKQDLGAPELEKSSKEQIQEVVKQPGTGLTEKEDLGGPHLEEQSNEANHEVVEKIDSVLTESQDLGAPKVEKCSKEHVEEPNLILTEKEDLGALKSEKCSKDEVIEQEVDNDSSVVADVSIEPVTLKVSSDNSVVNDNDASDVVHVPIGEEGKMNNQDSGAALSVASSSRSSLEGNWGSVSVLSTASIDAGTLQSTEKSKVNSGKSNAATSDVFEPPSFMTLVEPESKDKKLESSEVQDSQKQPNSDVSQAGWFPTMAKVNNETEGRKRNEEAIAKVTNWSTGKQSAALKNLLSKSPRGAQPEPVVKKDEAIVKPSVNDDVSSPPKMIDDDKKGKKKVKGISSWVPFVCCSSVNVVN